MLQWLEQNWGSLLIGGVVLLVLAAALAKLIRGKRQGKPFGCDCGCEGCGECPYKGSPNDQ